MLNIVVFISGNGSNLQAIIDATHRGLPVKIKSVISNEDGVYGLERAAAAKIPTHIVSCLDFQSRDDFDDALKIQTDHYTPDLIVLAGFMLRLGNRFVKYFSGKIINIHPSLLPKYPGLNTYRKALENKDKRHGTSIHYVTEDLDAGPIIAQEKLDILPEDTENTLKKRVQALEHKLYPKVLAELERQLMMNKIV